MDAEDGHRDWAADERDRAADARDRVADQREEMADRRESTDRARQRRLAEWEQRLDQRDRLQGRSVAGPRDREHQALARARDLQVTELAHLDRSEAALHREQAADLRQQREIDREIAASTQSQPDLQDDGTTVTALANAAEQLRTQLVATALELAEAEALAAKQHHQLARENPDSATDHRRLADHARHRAQLARETARRFSP